MSGTLLKREIKANYILTLIFVGVLTMYGTMIVSMYDPKLGDSLAMMAESMPQLFAAFGMLDVSSTLLEFISNYLYGFLLVAFPLVYIVLLSGRLISRYVDRGSMAYLLATPCRRRKIIVTQLFSMLLGIVTLTSYVTVLCIAVSQAMFPGQLDIQKFLFVNVGLLGLQIFMAGICFCSSCIFNEAKYATGVGAGLCIAFVLLQMVSQVGEKFEAIQYVTPLTLFNPKAIVAGNENAMLYCGILYAMGLVLFAVGSVVFCKRDIPV